MPKPPSHSSPPSCPMFYQTRPKLANLRDGDLDIELLRPNPSPGSVRSRKIISKIQNSPFQVEVAGHSDSDRMPKKWRKTFATNWELSAARGASVVRYMIEKGVPAPRLLAAGYGPWAPHGLDSVKKQNPMWNPLTLTWEEAVETKDGKIMPTVLGLNANEKMKSKNRRIQITFLNPPHHGKGRSATSYEE